MKAFHEVRSYGSDFMVWCQTYENISFLSHWHKEIELIYVSAGSCRINVGDQSFLAKGGDLVICDSGSIHYSDSYEEKNTLHFLIFDPGIISTVYEFSRFTCPHVTRTQLEEYGLAVMLEELFKTVERELTERESYYQDIVKARLREFWYLLKRRLPRESSQTASYHKRTAQLYDFQKLLSYMEEHYNENITLEYAAEQMNFSPSHFSKIFKRLTGINFVNYVNMLRVEKAMELLQSTPKKMTEIGLSCGFNNVRTFNRVFKEVTGYTPSQFVQRTDEEEQNSRGRHRELGGYNPSYYLQRYSQKKYVENDSMTLIQNK